MAEGVLIDHKAEVGHWLHGLHCVKKSFLISKLIAGCRPQKWGCCFCVGLFTNSEIFAEIDRQQQNALTHFSVLSLLNQEMLKAQGENALA